MNAIIKTLALTVILAALGVGGFHLGQYLQRGSLPALADLVPQKSSIQTPDKLTAVIPSTGPMARTVTLPSITGGPDGFRILIAPDIAAEITTGQDVVFFSLVDDRIYPVKGSVTNVDEENGQTKITITAPQAFLDTAPTVRAHIIIVETVGKRVPLSALLRDQNDDYFVWKAVAEGSGRFAIMHQKVSAGIIGDTYVELGPEILMEDFVITNPHPAIQNGEVTDVLISKMNAPIHDLSQQVRDRELMDKADAIRKEVEAFNAMTQSAPSVAGTVSNAPATDADTAPGGAAQQITPPAGECGSCGGSAYGGTPPATADDTPIDMTPLQTPEDTNAVTQ